VQKDDMILVSVDDHVVPRCSKRSTSTRRPGEISNALADVFSRFTETPML
jgi:hypothetical protein